MLVFQKYEKLKQSRNILTSPVSSLPLKTFPKPPSPILLALLNMPVAMQSSRYVKLFAGFLGGGVLSLAPATPEFASLIPVSTETTHILSTIKIFKPRNEERHQLRGEINNLSHLTILIQTVLSLAIHCRNQAIQQYSSRINIPQIRKHQNHNNKKIQMCIEREREIPIRKVGNFLPKFGRVLRKTKPEVREADRARSVSSILTTFLRETRQEKHPICCLCKKKSSDPRWENQKP